MGSNKELPKTLLSVALATTLALTCAVQNTPAAKKSESENKSRAQAGAPLAFDVASIVGRDAHSSENIIVGFSLPPFFQAHGPPNWASGGTCGPGNHANTYDVETTMRRTQRSSKLEG